ncbi:protein phosphatase 2C domain-containing protein [Methylotuvimicrobium sp. KM2]|uniref:PP2C family protein-serine/threonine phosphatase n=1 Tax=Methylotuvimicrobium sp. KM2 TaxID=3133976 RepID=UPI0031014772
MNKQTQSKTQNNVTGLIEKHLQGLLELQQYPGIHVANPERILVELKQLSNLYFPRPDWSSPLDEILVDRFELFMNDRRQFETLQTERQKLDFNGLYWASELDQAKTESWLSVGSEFLRDTGLVAQVLTILSQQGLFIVRFKPDYFAFYRERIDPDWEYLNKDALSAQNIKISKMEVGWMHGSLRQLSLPDSMQPNVPVTHAFAYALLYSLTRLPRAQHQGALQEQVDRFRLYNPCLPAYLRDFWRHYLQLPSTSEETPISCWQSFQQELQRNTQNVPLLTHIDYDIGGDSVYGRRKNGNDNEDALFYLREGDAVMLGVADGVSSAQLGRGRIASQTVKRQVDDQEFRYRRRLQNIAQIADTGQRLNEMESFLQTVFSDCQQAVVAEINRCYEQHKAQNNENSPTPIHDMQTMSTTLVLAVVIGQDVKIGHWGDSRAYLIDSEKTVRLTEDHNLRNENLQRSDRNLFEPLPPQAGSELTRVVGQCRYDSERQLFIEEKPRLSIDTCNMAESSFLLLCSDGLLEISDMSREKTAEIWLQQQMSRLRGENCREIARQLVRTADDEHGTDNITALLLSRLPTKQPQTAKENVADSSKGESHG